MVHAAGLERVDERSHDVFLAGQLAKLRGRHLRARAR